MRLLFSSAICAVTALNGGCSSLSRHDRVPAQGFVPIAEIKAAESADGLAAIVPPERPGERIEAHSEQYLPLHLGETPRNLLFAGKKSVQPSLPLFMRELGEQQVAAVLKHLRVEDAEVEAWPTLNDYGQWTWVLARWRRSSPEPWTWFERSDFVKTVDGEEDASILERFRLKRFPDSAAPIMLPHRYGADDFAAVFNDDESFADLYQKPVFGNCVWIDAVGKPLTGWLPIAQRRVQRDWHVARGRTRDVTCVALPQPPRLNDAAITFYIRRRGGRIEWPGRISWRRDFRSRAGKVAVDGMKIHSWPDDYTARLKDDLRVLTGEKAVDVDARRRGVRFLRKSNGQKDNQLLDMAEYLMTRYRALGVHDVRLQTFEWNGRPQHNLIAVIPGTGPERSKRPIIMADHYDTAYAQQVFNATGNRVSVPGADDNATATATLLRAAEILPALKLKSDVHLVHLTGEEFPADCLGARHLVMDSLTRGQDIGGVVLIDMIGYGWHKRDDDPGPGKRSEIFQVNPGFSPESNRMADIAAAVARKIDAGPTARRVRPAFRDPFALESYLYNTDGIIFSWAGYPVILFNEHTNRFNVDRPYYHEMNDSTDMIDWEYFTFVSKVAIETAAQLADK